MLLSLGFLGFVILLVAALYVFAKKQENKAATLIVLAILALVLFCILLWLAQMWGMMFWYHGPWGFGPMWRHMYWPP